MMAFLRSCSPPSIFLISPPSTRPANCSRPADSSAVDVFALAGPVDEHAKIVGFRCRARRSARLLPRRGAGAEGFSAPRSGCSRNRAPTRGLLSVRARHAGRAASKITPEIGGALHEVLVLAGQIIESDGHECLQRPSTWLRTVPSAVEGRTAARRASAPHRCTRTDLRFCHKSSARRACARRRPESRARKSRTCCSTRPYGSTNPRDAGIGRARQIAPLLDRAHRRLQKMLIRRRRVAVPRVVGNRRQQLAAARHRLTHQPRKHNLVADGRADRAVASSAASPCRGPA